MYAEKFSFSFAVDGIYSTMNFILEVGRGLKVNYLEQFYNLKIYIYIYGGDGLTWKLIYR